MRREILFLKVMLKMIVVLNRILGKVEVMQEQVYEEFEVLRSLDPYDVALRK